jgi:hypothetical protein
VGARVAVTAADRTRAIRLAALGCLIVAKAVGGWGVGWDIRWHLLIGRDSFWIPPHVMTYASVSLAALACAGVLLRETRLTRHGERPGLAVDVLGLTGTRGFHLAWWGMVMTIVAAPLDEAWHRTFGIDVTLWSPPHLLGLGGAQVSTLAVLLLAWEMWREPTSARTAVLLLVGTWFLSAFQMIIDPGVLTAFTYGGVRFFTWAILGGAAFAFSLVLAARLTGWRSAPLVLALGAVLVQWSIIAVADIGFAIVQPVPAVEEAIAADPTAPVAIAHEMSRRNGTVPGRSVLLRWALVLPAAVLTWADVRRRWLRASVLFAVSLVVVFEILLGPTPALQHARPDKADRAAALALTVVTACVGAWGATRTARWFTAPPPARAWIDGDHPSPIVIREVTR